MKFINFEISSTYNSCFVFCISGKGDIKSCSSVCPSVHHKNFNLAYNFQTPSWILTKFGGNVCLKEIYNSVGFQLDPSVSF